MSIATKGQLRAGTLDEIRERGPVVVTSGGHTIAVFYHEGSVYAVDNRCPHMGFPLARGTVKVGILTCHWHHARFDLCSGGTFDPFADDVRTFPVTISDGEVWVEPVPPARDEKAHWSSRLREGMEHDIRLVIAKSVLGLQACGADYRTPLTIGAEFGTTFSAAGWGPAMSILTCMANILPHLTEEDRSIALYHGLTADSDPGRLLAALGHSMLREDAGFHSFQIVDAGFQQYIPRRGTEAGRHVLIGMARFLAAHSPTPRAMGQTYQIALRLHRGEEIYRDV